MADYIKSPELPQHCFDCAEGVRQAGASMQCPVWQLRVATDRLDADVAAFSDGSGVSANIKEATLGTIAAAAILGGLGADSTNPNFEIVETAARACPGAVVGVSPRSGRLVADSLAFAPLDTIPSDKKVWPLPTRPALTFCTETVNTSLVQDDRRLSISVVPYRTRESGAGTLVWAEPQVGNDPEGARRAVKILQKSLQNVINLNSK